MKIENYDFTTIPQLYKDAWIKHKKNETYDFTYLLGMLKERDPLGLIVWKTQLFNPNYGCNVETFQQRLEMVFGNDNKYNNYRLSRILDFKIPKEYPHVLKDDDVLQVYELRALVNYIKGVEELWDDDSLTEKKSYWTKKKEKEAAEVVEKMRLAEEKQAREYQEGLNYLRTIIEEERLDKLILDGKLVFADIEEAKAQWKNMVLSGKDFDFGSDDEFKAAIAVASENGGMLPPEKLDLIRRMLEARRTVMDSNPEGQHFMSSEDMKLYVEQQFGIEYDLKWVVPHSQHYWIKGERVLKQKETFPVIRLEKDTQV